VRSLADLLAAPGGPEFLRARGVFTEPAAFMERLAPPRSDGIRRRLRFRESSACVYVAHQLQCDYRRSVVAKFRALRDLARDGHVAPVVAWVDTDRSGASKSSTTMTWPGDGQADSLRLGSRRYRSLETRFVPVDRRRLEAAVSRLGAWTAAASGSEGARERAERRIRDLADALLRDDVRTLAQANLAISSWLLRGLDPEPRPVLASDLANDGLLTSAVNDAVAAIDDFVAVFNAAVEELRAADVDPQVGPLDHRYLPLRYSCPRDGARLRMTRERRGVDHFALAICRCGAEHRFHLGSRKLSISALAASQRWSVDVTLLAYLNDLFSGAVAGRSSALYGLVLNAALEKALGRTPIPMLVPTELKATSVARDPNGLLHERLTAT
jgi:hypothetical protein